MWRSVLLLMVLACSKKQEAPADPPKGSGSSTPTPAAPADASAGSAVTPPAPVAAGFLPAKLAEKTGIVFAETKGGKVTGKGGVLADGAIVKIVGEVPASAGSMQDTAITVDSGGKSITVRGDYVLREDNVRRSPDGKFFVTHAISACGDLCHAVVWLAGNDGTRKKLGEAGPDFVVAWHPKGTEVAVGAAQVWIATLPDLTVKHLEDHRAPAYAPDGTLYVRDPKGSAFTIADGKPKLAWKNKDPLPTEGDEGMPPDDPDPVTFDKAGKPEFEIKSPYEQAH